MNQAMEHSTNGSNGHEHREANYKLILYSALGLSVVVFIVFVLMLGTFNILKMKDQALQQEATSPLASPFQIPPEPRLEEHPWESLQKLRAQEEHTLTTYGWQDQKAGVVRIPIQHAMDLLAQRGLPLESQQPQPKNPPAKAGRPVVPAANPAGANHAQ